MYTFTITEVEIKKIMKGLTKIHVAKSKFEHAGNAKDGEFMTHDLLLSSAFGISPAV